LRLYPPDGFDAIDHAFRRTDGSASRFDGYMSIADDANAETLQSKLR